MPHQSGFYFRNEEKILSGFIKSNGYKSIDLYKNGKSKKKHIHRLVAEAFIPNPNNLPEVNHKDEIRHHNNVENLEWISSSDNKKYGNCPLRQRLAHLNHPNCSKKIDQYSLDNKFIQTFPSAAEIERQMKIPGTSIIRCCKGVKTKTCHGYKWKYHEGGDVSE